MAYVETKETRYRSAGVAGAVGEAPLVPVDGARPGLARRLGRWAGHAVLSWLKTAALTFGVVYVVGWFVVTLGTAAVNRASMPAYMATNTLQRVLRYAPFRPYALAPDPSITADAAGVALEALAPPPRSANGFTQRVIGARAIAPWRDMAFPADLFPTARTGLWNGPDASKVLEAVGRGLSVRELSVLRKIATAPGWRQYDMVARAARVDMVGGRLVPPFPDYVSSFNMPIIKFAATKEWAWAGVSRAAWHLAQGQRDSAEFALRAIMSVGFAIQDNATSVIEELIGAVVSGIGGDALTRYYVITRDPRATALLAALEPPERVAVPQVFDEFALRDRTRWRGAHLKVAADPTIPPGFRYGALEALQLQGCGDVRELTLGPRKDARDAFDAARTELARFPSERAVLDLLQGSLETNVLSLPSATDPGVRAQAFLGRIYGNPRLATCMVAAFQWRTLQR